MNKGIIVMGGAGSGKTSLIDSIYKNCTPPIQYIRRVDPDEYTEDINSDFYKNPLAANRYIKNNLLPSILEDNRDFLFDTTGSNYKTIKNLVELFKGYDFKIIMNFCHPIICFRRNLLRKRIIPKSVIVQNFNSVYQKIKDYRDLIGEDNFYMYETTYSLEEKQLIVGDKYYEIKKGINSLLELHNSDSTFRKETTTYSEEELRLKKEKFNVLLNLTEFGFTDIEKTLTGIIKDKEELYFNLEQWISDNN